MYKNNKPIVIGDKPFLYALYMDSGFHRPVHTGDATSQMSALKLATGGIAQVQQEVPQSPAPNGPPSGIIGGAAASPEESVADDVPMEVPEGAFIINAAAAEVAGYGDIKKMIMSAIGVAKRLGIEVAAGNNETSEEEAVDLLVSKGEVYIEPTLAKIIGYDVLEKINNRGKKEVARRQQEAEAPQEQQAEAPQAPMQRGGFVKKKFAEGGDVEGPSPSDVAMGDIEAGFETLRYYGDDPVLRLALDDPKGLSTLVKQEYEDDSGPVGMYDVDKDLITLTRKAIKPSDFVSPQTEYSDTLGHELMHKGDADAGTTGSIMKGFQLHAVIASKSIQASKDSKGRIGDDTFNNTYRLLKNYVSGFDNAKQIRKDITKAYTSGKTNSERGDNILAVLENIPEFREIRQEAEDNARRVLAERKQQVSKKAQGFAEGGETRQEFPDYIKKYFMPEIDYHLETIRSKTVARNQYGQPTTAYTSGVRRGDKIYEIPTYDRNGGILSRAEVEASLDNYIEEYGDFGIPLSEYNTLMREKEAFKQKLYSTDNRFKVPEDAITQEIVLPEEEQQNSSGFIPKN